MWRARLTAIIFPGHSHTRFTKIQIPQHSATTHEHKVCYYGHFGKLLLTKRCLVIAQGSKVGIYAYSSSTTSSHNKAVFGALYSIGEATNKVLAKN